MRITGLTLDRQNNYRNWDQQYKPRLLHGILALCVTMVEQFEFLEIGSHPSHLREVTAT